MNISLLRSLLRRLSTNGLLNALQSPPQRPDLVAELLSGMRARQERDDGLFAGVRRSMAYDQLPGAERRLDRAVALGDQEEIARATRALSRVREEIDD